MRNFTNYATEGQKKISKNSHYDMQITDYNYLVDKLKSEELTLFEIIELAFNAGVEAGSRIEKKTAAEKMDKAMSGMIDAQMKMTAAVIKAERS